MVLKGEEIVLVIMDEVCDSHHEWEEIPAARQIELHTVSS
jgi:hypothetical protein